MGRLPKIAHNLKNKVRRVPVPDNLCLEGEAWEQDWVGDAGQLALQWPRTVDRVTKGVHAAQPGLPTVVAWSSWTLDCRGASCWHGDPPSWHPCLASSRSRGHLLRLPSIIGSPRVPALRCGMHIFVGSGFKVHGSQRAVFSLSVRRPFACAAQEPRSELWPLRTSECWLALSHAGSWGTGLCLFLRWVMGGGVLGQCMCLEFGFLGRVLTVWWASSHCPPRCSQGHCPCCLGHFLRSPEPDGAPGCMAVLLPPGDSACLCAGLFLATLSVCVL